MTTRRKTMSLLLTVLMLITASQPSWMGYTISAHVDGSTPGSLPFECGGVTPPGQTTSACCIYGYVYYDGTPVDGANVDIESPYGDLNTTTMSGPNSGYPYYGADLSYVPLLTTPGDIITITASYSGMVSARTWMVQSDGQQVDLGLVTGFQSPGPAAVVAVDVNDQSTSATIHGRPQAMTMPSTAKLPGDLGQSQTTSASTTRVSVTSGGIQGNDNSLYTSISADGRYVAFGSYASNLVAGDTNGTQDAFVHDRQTGQITRVSIDSDGIQGNGNSCYWAAPSISADGRYVAFGSAASNLVSDDTNGALDVFVRDRQASQTTRVSVASDSSQGNGDSCYQGTPSISGDGRYVAFFSAASNLVISDTNGALDVFVHDRQTDQTTRVSVASDSSQGNGDSWNTSISADGRYVTFQSGASNLVSGDTNGALDVFVHDQQTGQTTRVSIDSGGTQGNDSSEWPSISADGRYVAFRSTASNLVSGDTNGKRDVFVHDRQTGQTARVSVDSAGTQANNDSCYWEAPSISADGRYVAFGSTASNLVSGDTNARWDTFIHDRQTGQTTRLSVNSDGTQGEDSSHAPSVSADGRYAAFFADANNLVSNDTNDKQDVFVRDRGANAYSISGQVRDGGSNPISDVIISAGAGNSAITNVSGWYTITDLVTGTYIITPSKTNWTFTPISRTVSVPPSATGQDFTGVFPWTPPDAAFTAAPLFGTLPLTVTFTDQSTGDITTWSWTFGDGGVSGARHPAHVYQSAGVYTVTLTVAGPGGSDVEAKANYITVSPYGIPVAEINYIWPDPASYISTIYFNGNSYDSDEGGAYIIAYNWRSDLDGWLSDREDFIIPAAELSVGLHTIYFKCQDDEGVWSPEATRTLTVLPPEAAVRTLILFNRQKLTSLYGSTEADQVVAKLDALAAHGSVEGLVVQVEGDAAVASAYAAWDADPTSTTKANAVAEAIKALIASHWAANPGLEYLVIVGDDRAIPFRRVLDQTPYPERYYPYVSATSTTGAALRDDMTLTDDYYADAVPTVPDSPGWDGHALYIPDLGTGRLVETPAEIISQIDAFLTDDEVTAGNAIVTGYDFIKDGAQAMCGVLNGDGLTADCTLIGQSWNAGQFKSQVLDTRHDIVSINGHANHYIVGTPSGYVTSGDVAGAAADHTGVLFYTVGCHSGLNVPPTNPYQPLDTAQAVIQHDSSYVANTGYGWGYITTVGLSEQLMLDFSERLVYGQSATAGQALAAAKQEYYLNESHFDYYDEKILIESTLYGLPMVHFATPTTAKGRAEGEKPGATAIKEERVTDLGNGLTVNSLSYQFPALLAETTPDGLYYTFGGLAHSGHGEPIQPKYTVDLFFPQTEAHGIVFKGGVYTDVASFNPVIDRAVTETATLTEPAFSAPSWYPAVLHRLNRLERGDKLVTLLGQFNAQAQVERVYDRLSFDVYYHTGSSDWTAPSITSMSSNLEGDTCTITVNASDDSGIETIIVAYTDGNGTWSSIELTETEGAWDSSFPAAPPTRFFIQVVDQAGNVAIDDDDGLYYQPGDYLEYYLFLPLVLRETNSY